MAKTRILVANVAAAEEELAEPVPIPSLLSPGTHVVWVDPGRAGPAIEAFQNDLDDVFGAAGAGWGHYLAWEDVQQALAGFPRFTVAGGARMPAGPPIPKRV